MIITHTQDAHGNRRIYLGGKSSLECWIEPSTDGHAWQFRMAEAVSGNPVSVGDQRECAVHTLFGLADMLGVAAQELKAVPFEAIAALHSSNPFDGRRIATPKKHSIDHGFMPTAPHITRPKGDFATGFDKEGRRRI